MNRTIRLLAATLLLATAGIRILHAQTTWDLTHLAGTNGDIGPSATFTLSGGYGSITVFTDPAPGGCSYLVLCVNEVYANGYDTALPDASKGLGTANCGYFLGFFFLGCNGGTVSAGFGALWFDVSGLAPGVHPSYFTLASIDATDDWQVNFSTSSTCNTSTVMNGSSISGHGPIYGGAYADLGFLGSTCAKLTNPGSGGFVLQSITTTGAPTGGPLSTAPEPATITLLAIGLAGIAGSARGRRRKG